MINHYPASGVDPLQAQPLLIDWGLASTFGSAIPVGIDYLTAHAEIVRFHAQRELRIGEKRMHKEITEEEDYVPQPPPTVCKSFDYVACYYVVGAFVGYKHHCRAPWAFDDPEEVEDNIKSRTNIVHDIVTKYRLMGALSAEVRLAMFDE